MSVIEMIMMTMKRTASSQSIWTSTMMTKTTTKKLGWITITTAAMILMTNLSADTDQAKANHKFSGKTLEKLKNENQKEI